MMGDNYMEHSFDVDIATKLGIQPAIIFKNLYFWIKKNEANNKHFYDGYYWTYNSKKAFSELFPYMTERQIDYAIKKLIDAELVITGNYNKVAYDRTLWYAITKKGYSILQNCEMETTKLLNGDNKNVKPIPDSKPNAKPNSKPDSKKSNKFIPPTLEEVEEYCSQRGNKVDAQYFYDYFTVSDWVDSKGNKVKNWKQKIITWERNSKGDNNNAKNIRRNNKKDGGEYAEFS